MTKGNGSIRAASYQRVSTALQATEGLSLAEQERRLAEYIEGQDWQHVETYTDAGISGKREDRPQFQRLLRDLDGIDRLVIVKLDRIGRSARHLLELFDRLERAGVELVSLNDNIDTSTATGRMLPKLLAVLAEWEADNLGERTRAVHGARVRQGKHHGRPPYGYEPRDGILSPVPHEAAVVRRIFEEFLAGRSQRAITRGLIDDGIPAPRTNWHQGTISQILRNDAYAGRIRFNDAIHPGQHSPIIEPPKWHEAAKLLDAAARTKGGGRGKTAEGLHLFVRGHLRCGQCGEAMVPRADADTYECYGRKRLGVGSCDQRPVKRALIDESTYQYFQRVGLDLEATRAQLSAAIDRQLAEVRALRERAEREAQHAAERVVRVKRDYQDGKLDADDWREQRAELTQECKAANAAADRLRKQEQRIAEGAAMHDVEEETLRYLAEIRAAVAGEVSAAATVEAVRAVLLKLFSHFTLLRGGSGRFEVEYTADGDPTFDAIGTDGYLIVTQPRAEAVEGIDGNWQPILRREPLLTSRAFDGEGLPIQYLFRPIPCGIPA